MNNDIQRLSEEYEHKVVTYPKQCPQCKGKKYHYEKIKNLGTGEYREAIVSCDMCSGKGYVSKEDYNRYLHSIGIVTHPKES
jgi:hypothetical protein